MVVVMEIVMTIVVIFLHIVFVTAVVESTLTTVKSQSRSVRTMREHRLTLNPEPKNAECEGMAPRCKASQNILRGDRL